MRSGNGRASLDLEEALNEHSLRSLEQPFAVDSWRRHVEPPA